MQGVAFDLEGTCVDLEPLHFAAYEHALADFGVAMRAEDIAAIPGAIGGGGPVILEALSPLHPVLADVPLRERKATYFNALFEKAVLKPRLGLVDFIEYLLAGGIPISVGSTTRRSFGVDIIRRSGLDVYFKPEICIFREDVTSLKPSPEVYLRTAELMHITPPEQLIFEDSIVGVQAGVAAGANVFAIPVPLALRDERTATLEAAGAKAWYPEWTMVPRKLYNAISKQP